ncbi:MAG: hypothetical protein RLZZ505_2563 [Verrucomicrobiota bacterium]|jgi:hypothetical protein
MGQQSNKIIKRRRRVDYLKRKKEQEKLGGLLPKAKVKKLTPKTDDDAEARPAAKKVAAKKVAAKKVAAKKAPAKKVAREVATPEESSEA